METMKTWELVKRIEREKALALSDIKEVRSIMIFNYGEHGMCHANVVRKDMSLSTMIYETFNFYERELKTRHWNHL